MGLMITPDDVQVAFPNQEIDPGQCAFLIKRASSFVQNKVDVTFGLFTDVVVRKKTDWDGTLYFVEFPINNLSLIHDVPADLDLSQTTPCGPFFDSIDTIYGLIPRHVYDCTIDYGLPVPDDIKGVLIDAVFRGLNSLPSGLKSLTVGDVIEEYNGLLDFPQYDLDIIENYSTIHATWKTTDARFQTREHRHNIVLNGPDFCGDDDDCSW